VVRHRFAASSVNVDFLVDIFAVSDAALSTAMKGLTAKRLVLRSLSADTIVKVDVKSQIYIPLYVCRIVGIAACTAGSVRTNAINHVLNAQRHVIGFVPTTNVLNCAASLAIVLHAINLVINNWLVGKYSIFSLTSWLVRILCYNNVYLKLIRFNQ
jgi:hypothetical protein